jgi:hypothetical protein
MWTRNKQYAIILGIPCIEKEKLAEILLCSTLINIELKTEIEIEIETETDIEIETEI